MFQQEVKQMFVLLQLCFYYVVTEINLLTLKLSGSCRLRSLAATKPPVIQLKEAETLERLQLCSYPSVLIINLRSEVIIPEASGF